MTNVLTAPALADPHPAWAALPHPAERPDLVAYFTAKGVNARTLDHTPIFTVEEGRELKADLPGAHTKNLFLTDKDGALVLFSVESSARPAVNKLHRLLGLKRLSFAKADVMEAVLGVTPGSVTAFALVNDRERRVRFLLDADLHRAEAVNFHPLTNAATTHVSRADFDRFLESLGRTAEIIDLSALADA